MSTDPVAPRFRWAMEVLSVAPDARVLEVGCGHGIALGLVAARLRDGCVLGIDRSEKMITQASRRNADAIRAGRVLARTGTLADVELGLELFDVAFAINVSLFSEDDVHVELSRLREHLCPGGALYLFHEAPVAAHAKRFATVAARNLDAQGFTVRTVPSTPSRACVVGQASG
ncbi:class I SAM-dependent methyltransferase [Corallococcus sp. AB011P]|uniref:class I SAM-dependent methyltransferase n=1 Tax=Corallococcus sp. AB011P TaxID=2316735 RepID=UPI000EA3549F|nr:class I SAM-dependent methyltransferase [Corallococcus sp. AB011P]RKG60782.1 class I SAM-dependent methyltransferase [Corallococcus sp. AB011P]